MQDSNEARIETEDCCLVCSGRMTLVLDGIFDVRFGAPGIFQVKQCLTCGLEQTVPRLKEAELRTAYETYYNFQNVDTTDYSRRRGQLVRSGLYRIWVRLDGDISFVLRRGNNRRLLDIGCNEGRNLILYRRNGFQPEGLETNSVAAATARKEGFIIHSQEIGTLDCIEPFDVVVLSNVLEHVSNPDSMLRDARALLRPGGELWISCPNSSSFARRLFGDRWINWHPPFHLCHFSRQTLECLLEKADLEVTDVKTRSPTLWIVQSALAYLYAKPGSPTFQMRRPALVGLAIIGVRLFGFPFLLVQHRRDKGECLIVIARRRANERVCAELRETRLGDASNRLGETPGPAIVPSMGYNSSSPAVPVRSASRRATSRS